MAKMSAMPGASTPERPTPCSGRSHRGIGCGPGLKLGARPWDRSHLERRVAALPVGQFPGPASGAERIGWRVRWSGTSLMRPGALGRAAQILPACRRRSVVESRQAYAR